MDGAQSGHSELSLLRARLREQREDAAAVRLAAAHTQAVAQEAKAAAAMMRHETAEMLTPPTARPPRRNALRSHTRADQGRAHRMPDKQDAFRITRQHNVIWIRMLAPSCGRRSGKAFPTRMNEPLRGWS